MNKIYILLVIVCLGVGTVSAQQEQNEKLFEISKNLEIFSEIYRELSTDYVDDLDPSSLMRTGIDAMMHSLDPYTVYYSESQIEAYRYLAQGKYDGIGADVKFIDDYVTLVELYKGYAADRAGLKPGDQIIKLEGRSTEGKSTEELSLLMKGDINQALNLTIYRPVTSETIEVSVKRDQIQTPNVPYSGFVSDDVGYVVLTTFTANAGGNVRKAIQELKNENPEMKGIIIDLRNNGGGLLSEAVNLSNIFIPQNKLVVSTRSKIKDTDKTYTTKKPPLDLEIPVVVLVNKMSASASEIVSGTLQDYDRAVIMGQRTYGKGLVQNTKKLSYNTSMKLTTAKYYIPSGRCIQAVEYDDGEPVDIADSLRSEFKTENGRVVLDGGGVTPDIVLDQPETPPAIKALIEKNIIFKYVNNYVETHDPLLDLDGFTFTDYNDFKKFVDKYGFSFKTKSEESLTKLENKLKKESYYGDVEDLFNKIEKEMQQAKEESIDTYQKEITDLIEKEIAVRYFYQEGKIKQSLKDDPEVRAAIDLLKNKQKIEEVLSS